MIRDAVELVLQELIEAEAAGAWWTVAGPLLMTVLLRRPSPTDAWPVGWPAGAWRSGWK